VAFRRRLQRLFLLIVLAVSAVWLRALQLQVVEGDEWRAQARQKRERLVVVEGPRGKIVDRRGEVLAVDRSVFQLAFVGWKYQRRARLRCTACGAIHTHLVDHPPHDPRCRCGEASSGLEPLPLPDPSPLEDLLGLPTGALAERAEDRLQRVEELVEARRERLDEEGRPDFLAHDEERLYRADLLHRPYVIVPRIPEEAVRLLELDEDGRYRGFRVQTTLRRHYPEGGPASQMLGYVSVIHDEKELAEYQDKYPRHVSLDTRVGRAGLEQGQEQLLLGRFGRERQARDADGSFTEVVWSEPPRAGSRVTLALTVEACQAAERALATRGRSAGYLPRTQPSGGFVALYADTGEIVAWGEMPRLDIEKDLPRMYSEADQQARFDPALGEWVLPDGVDPPRGLTVDQWRAWLTKPAPRTLSRVSQIAVEPGSTFKIFIGLGLLDGLRRMAPGTELPYDHLFGCTGLGGFPGCHSHSLVDFIGALETSCNRYFAYSLRDFPGYWKVYRRTVPALLASVGFGVTTGVDVWVENAGVLLRDYVDFDPLPVVHEACVAVREAQGLPPDALSMRTLGRVPPQVAGRDPRRLSQLLVTVLGEAVAVAGRAGQVGLTVEPGTLDPLDPRDERVLPIRFEISARPHPEAVAPAPLKREMLERRVGELGGRLETEIKPRGLVTLSFELRYHEPVGRASGEPNLILPDDGRNLGIGQGPISVTPLQMARAVAVLANGGRLVTPHAAILADGVQLRHPASALPLDPRDVDLVRAGMRAVVVGEHGTARKVGWETVPAEVYGKTGTAQVGRFWVAGERPVKGPWHHWFVGFSEAPGHRPLAFACVLHARMEGAAALTSAEAVRDFLAWWYTRGPDVGGGR
jgi:cell division protein FtsI/penicillin-binding protein 2